IEVFRKTACKLAVRGMACERSQLLHARELFGSGRGFKVVNITVVGPIRSKILEQLVGNGLEDGSFLRSEAVPREVFVDVLNHIVEADRLVCPFTRDIDRK